MNRERYNGIKFVGIVPSQSARYALHDTVTELPVRLNAARQSFTPCRVSL